jgi:hypothetical protein
MRRDPIPERFELRCYPCEGGFAISLSAPIGASYWLEYYALGAGGYQETGEITGTISSRPEILHRAVDVTVIEVAVISMTLGAINVGLRPTRAIRHSFVSPESRPIPPAAVQIGSNEEHDK